MLILGQTASGSAWNSVPANLLVVFLLVTLYKPARGKSNEIFSCAGPENPRVAEETRLQPRGYDFFRVFCAPLATDRGWTPHHRPDPPPDLCGLQDFRLAIGARIGQGGLRKLIALPRSPANAEETRRIPKGGFADLCGLDRTYIGGIERGERNVSLVNIEKIAKALKVSLSELFRGV